MKLKLSTQGAHTVLSVTEMVADQQIPVLKAGLNKIFQAGKKTVLLDLTDISADPAILQEIAQLQVWALDSGAQIIIASPVRGVGHAQSVQEGLQLLGSELGKLLALEAKLQGQLKSLQLQRSEIEKTLSTLGGNEATLQKLRRDNSELKTTVTNLEKEVSRRFRVRTEPYQSDLVKAKTETLHRVLNMILDQQNLLPGGA